MLNALREAQVKIISPQEVSWAVEKSDRVIIDIRPPEDFQKGHIPGALNVPFYVPISGWTPWQIARRVGYAAFGISHGTEPNPDFMAEVAKVCPDKEAATGPVLVCSLGVSTLEDSSSRLGVQSRSVIACYAMATQGYRNMALLKGGYLEWASSGRDVVQEEEPASS